MKLKLSFLGAAQNVTGSRFLLEANKTRLLVDCGLYQERKLRGRNWDPFPFPPRKIDAVLLTHAHLDHCGLLPKLVHDGFRGKIYCTSATGEIAKIVVLDSAHIQEEDAKYKRRRHKREGRTGPRPVVPLYTTADAEACTTHFRGDPYETTIKIADNVEATFHDAGHVLGAAIIKLKVTEGHQQRTILFSGDLGRPGKPILRDPVTFEQADYVLIESTYGNRVHEPTEAVGGQLAEAINSTLDAGGNVVIPSFAIERSQEILYHLNELLLKKAIPRLPVFLDSPMAARVTKVFQDHSEMFDEEMREQARSPFKLPGLEITRTSDDSKAINDIRQGAVIIAGSGMCTGGRVKHHLVNNITRPECTVLFVGYQAAGTLGRRIVNGEDEVRILGQTYPVRAKIVRVQGFSAHADREELMQWLGALKSPPRRVFVVHGEAESAKAFAQHIKQQKNWDAIAPEYGDKIRLD